MTCDGNLSDRKGFSASPEPCPPPRRRTTTEKRAGPHQKWTRTMSMVVWALHKFFISFLPLFFFQLTNSFHFIGYEHPVMTALETAHPRPATTNDDNGHVRPTTTRSGRAPTEPLLQGRSWVYCTHDNIHGHQHPGPARWGSMIATTSTTTL